MGTGHDLFSPEAMTDYFHQLYSRIESFDKKDMKYYLYNMKELMFETAAKEFQLIDDTTTPVLVNWEDSLSLLGQLEKEGPSYALMKRLGQYSVSMRTYDLERLIKDGIVEKTRCDSLYASKDHRQYSKDVGLLFDNHWVEETWII